jgi:hypothetical protein
MFKTNHTRSIFVILFVSLFYLGLRVYFNFAATGTLNIVRWIAESLPHHVSQVCGLWLFLLVDTPLIIINSLAVALALAVFFQKGLWKYGLGVGILSQIIWVIVFRIYILGESMSSFATVVILEGLMCVLGPCFAGCFIEWIFSRWCKQMTATNSME